MESAPLPTMMRNSRPMTMQKSVRPSCMAAQKPDFISMGSLVVAMATEMSMSRGIGRKTREQSDDKQEAAGDFHRSDERCEEVRGGNANLRKAAHAERGGKEELLNAFGEKNPAHQDANEDHGRGRAGTQQPALD